MKRDSVNSFLNTSQTEDEFISNKIREFYLRRGSGLRDLHRRFFPDDEPLAVPKKRIRLLLLGNHSSGKSTFINWYMRKHVLQTSVAIETRQFVIVRHGKVNDVQRGYNTIKFFPDFAQLKTLFGASFVRNYLVMNIVASDTNKSFRMVDLIDTPGLLDEEYDGFDMNKVVAWWADHVDVIFVFMDPYIKSTCRRTVEVIKMLFSDSKTSQKVHLFLSKCDEVTNEIERSRVLKQVSEGLAKLLPTRRVKILPIFIPELEQEEGEEAYIKIVRRRYFPKQEIPNCINLACEMIEDQVRDNVGNNLTKMAKDVRKIGKRIRGIMRNEDKKIRKNRNALKRKMKSYFISFLFLLVFFGLGFVKMGGTLINVNLEIVTRYIEEFDWVFDTIHPYEQYEWVLWVFLLLISLIFFLVGKCQAYKTVLPKENRTELNRYKDAINGYEVSLDDMNRHYKEERV